MEQKKRGKQMTAEEKKARSVRLRRCIIVAGVALAALGAAVYFLELKCFRSAENAGQTALVRDEARQVAFLDGDFICYSGNGLSVSDSRGRTRFSQSVSMGAPRLMVKDGFGALGDIEGSSLVIFDAREVTGTVQLAYPLLDFDVSAAGVVALAVDEGTTTRICYYDKTGRALKVEMTLELSLSGYPLELALAPGGKGLILSNVTTAGGVLSDRISFYDFDLDTPKNESTVGYFTYEDCLFPDIRYLGSGAAVAFGTDRLLFFSLENGTLPTLKKELVTAGTLQAVTTRGARVLTVVTDSRGTEVFTVYDASGNVQTSVESSEERLGCGLTERGLWLLSPEGLQVWNARGRLRFSGSLGSDSTSLFFTGRTRAVQWTADAILRYRLAAL